MEKAGANIKELIAVGGGARSHLWLRIKADVLGRPVNTLKIQEAACLGAAILAGAASGIYHSVDEGVTNVVQHQETFSPDAKMSKKYAEKYMVYRQLYPALIPINKEL